MMDEDRTLQLFGYTSDELKPQSNKKIVAVCEKCGTHRVLAKQKYTELCHSCAMASTETRRKLSEAHTGKTASEETRRKLSEAHTGRTFSEETRRKISEANMRRPAFSAETRSKISEANRCRPPISEETRQKISESSAGRRYAPRTEETRIKHSCARQGITLNEWRGFVANSPYCSKFDDACRERNREKYGRICFICGKTEEDNRQRLSVHHVDLNKQQGCDGTKWGLLPLCRSCHNRVHTGMWQARIEYLLKCMEVV